MRSISIESSTPFTPRSPVEQGWGCLYAAPLSMLMGASCGRKRTNLAAPYLSSPCRRRKRTHEFPSIGVRGCRAERRAGGPAVPLHLERAIVLRQQSPAVPAVGVVSAPDALQKGEPEVAVLDDRVARAALRRLAGGPLQDVQFTLLDL